MAQVNLSFTISILVPVMFILVFETAGKARDLDLYDMLPDDDPQPRSGWERKASIVLTRLPGLERGQHIPRFGHFGSLHSISMVILLYGAALVGYGLSGEARYVLGLAIWVMVAVLPLIEVDEYKYIDKLSVAPQSVRLNGIGNAVTVPLASGLGNAYAIGTPLFIILILGLLLVAIPSMITAVYFSTSLEQELRENQPSLSESTASGE